MNKNKLLFNSLFSIIMVFICLFIFINNAKGNINIYNFFINLYNGWAYLLAASFLLIISVYIRSLRWKYLFQTNIPIRTKDLFSAQLFGYFINNISPIRIGDFGKSYLIAKKTHTTNSYILGSIIMERFLDTFMLIIFSIITIWYYGTDYLNINFSSLPNSIYILIPIALIMFFIIYYSIVLLPIKMQNILNEIWTGFTTIKNTKINITIIFSVLIWLIYWCNVFLIQSIFISFELTYIDCLFILVASSLIQMIPTGFGALGVFHLGAEAVLLKLGIIDYHNFLIMLWLYSYFIYSVLGGYYFIRNGEFTIKNLYSDLIKNH